MKRCGIITVSVFGVLGILLIVAGVTLIFEYDNIVKKTIDDKVVLKNGSAAFNTWKQPPATVYMQFWMFNVENMFKIITGEEKPNVTQKGPYTYREVRDKEAVEFLENGTRLSYREKKAYVFERDLSVGPENDTFTFVNLPILTVAAILENMDLPALVLDGVSRFLAYEKERLFEKHTVGEFLWGYHEKTLEKINSITSKYLHYNFSTVVGLFTGPNTNGSDDGEYEIFTGEGDLQKLNTIALWRNSSLLPYWKTKYCNMINGTDGSMWHPFVNKSEKLYIFSSDICRSIYVNYVSDVDVQGISTYHFVPPESIFQDHKRNPANAGFCVPQCLDSGVLDVWSCKKAPIVVSQPHFYQGSSIYIDAITGMHPESQFSTFMDIEPYTGLALSVAKKLQLNAKITKLKAFSDTANFLNMTIFPMLWLNESATLDQDGGDKFKAEVITPMVILEGVQYALVALGILIIICVLIYVIQDVVRSRKQSGFVTLVEDDEPRGDI